MTNKSGSPTEALYTALIRGFCALAEFRDPETGAHLDRLAAYAQVLVPQLQRQSPYASACTDTFLEQLVTTVPLHDIGKVSVPDRVLLKPGPLTGAEMAIMQTHAAVGRQLLLTVRSMVPAEQRTLMDLAADVAGYHHERWDGTGYPAGLKGEAIPLAARITALVDVYDALSTPRVYRQRALPPDEVRDHIAAASGTHFDPVLVEAFLAVEGEFRRLRQELQDRHVATPLPPAAEALPQREAVRVLIVDDEPVVRRIIQRVLSNMGLTCDEAGSVAEARTCLGQQDYDLVTLDICMPNEPGTLLLEELAPRAPWLAVMLMTAAGDLQTAVAAMRGGAYDYVLKPLDITHLRLAVDRVLERQRLEQELIAYRTRLEHMVAARLQAQQSHTAAP